MNKKKQVVRDMTELPVYEITFEDDGTQGIRMVSLVKDPAIEIKGMYFSAQELKDFEFKTFKDKQIVVGPAMVPNKKILRKDDNDNPYFVVFSAETIRQMSNKFNKENSNKDINVDHSDKMVPGFIQANWIIENTAYDKSRYYGYNNLPVDTWFVEMKIEDSKFWETEVKDGGKYSFSIEGMMGQEPLSMSSVIDSMSLNELYQLFISLDDIPIHPNCRCEADEYIWVCQPDACDECLDAQKEYNDSTASGDYEMAMAIFNKHTGKQYSKK